MSYPVKTGNLFGPKLRHVKTTYLSAHLRLTLNLRGSAGIFFRSLIIIGDKLRITIRITKVHAPGLDSGRQPCK